MNPRVPIIALALSTVLASAAAAYFYDRARTAEARLRPIDEMGARLVDARAKRDADERVQEVKERALEEEKQRLEAQMKEQAAKVDGLLAQLASAKDEATRLAIQKQLEEVREEQKSLSGGTRGSRGRPACNCTPGDPLCSCQ